MKAVIYTRVSSEDQIENTSLESQERICREYCKKMGYDVARVFSDRGESAKTSDRPAFLEMIRYATSTPCIESAIVYKLDRFARNQFDTAIFIRALATKGVSLRSATEQITDGMEGKIMRGVLALLAEIDNDIRADRSKASMRSLIEKGYWVHQAPLGYVVARDPQGNPILKPDPITGPPIRAAFEQIAFGEVGTVFTTKKLAQINVVTKYGKRVGVSSLHKILRRPIYAGRIISKLAGHRVIKAAFQPLVSESIFDRVQAILSGRGRIEKPYERQRDDLPLRQLIACGKCGRLLTASISRGHGGKYAYYHCFNKECDGLRIRAETLHSDYEKLLESVTGLTHGRFRLFREIVLDQWKKRLEQSAAEKVCADSLVKHLEGQQARLLDKLLSGVISDEIYKVKANALQVEMAIAKSSHHDADLDQIDIEGTLDMAENLCSNAKRLWQGMDAMGKWKFQKVLFPQGLAYDPATGFRTSSGPCVFGLIPLSAASKSQLATQTPIGWNQIKQLAEQLAAYRRGLAA